MITRVQITAIIVIAVLVIAGTLWIAGEQVSGRIFWSIGAAVGVNAVAITVFNKWIWRWRLLQGWFVNRPYIGGEWRARIEYQWNGNRGTIDTTLSVQQTYASVHAQLQSDESKGELISSEIVGDGSGRYKFAAIYRNEPRLGIRDQSPIHNGAFVLDIEGYVLEPTALRGSYWTDRRSRGDMVAERGGPA